jgi:nitrate/nitrite-specific signal transduction histidine kinase
MDEGEILEMADVLKKKYEELEKKEELQRFKLQEMTKSLCVAYGCARLLDQMSEMVELPISMDFLIGSIRSSLSDILFTNEELDF